MGRGILAELTLLGVNGLGGHVVVGQIASGVLILTRVAAIGDICIIGKLSTGHMTGRV